MDIKLQIWDPPGDFNALWNGFLKGTSGVLIVFDLSNPDTFYNESFRSITEFVIENTTAKVILIANKSDLIKQEEWGIKEEDIDNFKAQYNIEDIIITSAKTGSNIDLAFKRLSNIMINERSKNEKIKREMVFKVVLAGLPYVGKTSILERYVSGVFHEESKKTIGAEFLTKKIEYEPDIINRVKTPRQKKKKGKDKKEIIEDITPEEVEKEDMEVIPAEDGSVFSPPGGGLPRPVPERSMMKPQKKRIERKTTVFYKERMNPMKLNKMAVIISTEEIYESLKMVSKKVARAATGVTMEIEEDVPTIEVKPIIPGCVCMPSIGHLDAEEEYDHVLFLITPLEDGDIPDARVEIYYKDKLIDTIPTPINVVKTTIVKISTAFTLIIPILGSLFDQSLEGLLKAILPFYELIGGLDGLLAILTGIFSVMTAIFYYLRKPRDAAPVESSSLPDVVSTVAEE